LCSVSLVATAIANPPELNFVRGVFHGALQTLHYDINDMHNPTPNIQEVIVFTKWLSDKQILPKSESEVYAVWPHLDPRNKCFPSSKFYVNLHTCRPCHQEQFIV
jgi:hypothetical protein